MTITRREQMLFVTTGLVALYGLSLFLARPVWTRMKDIVTQIDAVEAQTVRDRKMVEQRDRWTGEFDELKQQLSGYPADQKMDIHWMSMMDRIATRHGVKILRRQAGEEVRIGTVYELPVECQDWEATLDSLIKFLFELQSEGGMLDIRQLMIKPRGDNVLRGRFTLYCAYTREETPSETGK